MVLSGAMGIAKHASWLFASALVIASDAQAQTKPKDVAIVAPQVKVSPTAMADLKSGDVTKVRAALDDIRLAGKHSGAPFAGTIVELLQRGVTTSLAEAACDTLGDLEAESASTVIAEYTQHRAAKVRQAAAKALVKTKGAAAVKALVHSLSDSDAMVRGVAANGLGQLKAKAAVADLF